KDNTPADLENAVSQDMADNTDDKTGDKTLDKSDDRSIYSIDSTLTKKKNPGKAKKSHNTAQEMSGITAAIDELKQLNSTIESSSSSRQEDECHSHHCFIFSGIFMRNTVRLWSQRFEEEGHVRANPRSARPRKITPDCIDRMVATYEQQPFTPTRVEQFDCSAQCVRRSLRRAGIHQRKPAIQTVLSLEYCRPPYRFQVFWVLNDVQKTARVRFARDYRDFDFSRTIFSDEKSLISSQHGRQQLWCVNNTRSEPRDTSGHIVVNIWAWMSGAGPGELMFIPGKTNGAPYLELLKDTMLPT
ncbi:Uncharacterized protein OBRU01_00903, partial [Operophtera brumata]